MYVCIYACMYVYMYGRVYVYVCKFILSNFLSSIYFNTQLSPDTYTVTNFILANRMAAAASERNVSDI